MQAQRQSEELSSEASYCERETLDEWGSRSSLTKSHLDDVATQSTTERTDYVNLLKAERDSLSRALSAERARAQNVSRAHDARLAELHAVIAELLRRGRSTAEIREESEEDCESTTQPAEELDHDADRSRTDQNETSSMQSAAEPSKRTDDEEVRVRLSEATECESSTEPRDSYHHCLNAARRSPAAGSSCERARGSDLEPPLHTVETVMSESRQAKLASRVRLKRTEDSELEGQLNDQWLLGAERLARDVCAQADATEALAAVYLNDGALQSAVGLARARSARLEADVRVLECALQRASDNAHRLSTSCAVHESNTVALCAALKAADEALETYDVILALTETDRDRGEQRAAAELVAKQLLSRLDAPTQMGQPLLSKGPWLTHTHSANPDEPWTAECEARLRAHAARLKAETAALRVTETPPALFSYHDAEKDLPSASEGLDMEAAVMFQEVAAAVERRAEMAAKSKLLENNAMHESLHERSSSYRSQRSRKQWTPRAASETDL